MGKDVEISGRGETFGKEIEVNDEERLERNKISAGSVDFLVYWSCWLVEI